jgi:hypothetical protein
MEYNTVVYRVRDRRVECSREHLNTRGIAVIEDEQAPPKNAPESQSPHSESPATGAVPDAPAADSSGPTQPAPAQATSPQGPSTEMSREEKIAAARAKAEALKAQRAQAGAAPGVGTQAKAPAAAAKAWATSENPGGAPPAPPQNPQVRALGTITQSVELRCESSEDQNIRKILGGLGAYKNPLRGAWQIDYRYYAEALKRLQAAGYQVDGRDYLGRPLDQWAPEKRGWTRLS